MTKTIVNPLAPAAGANASRKQRIADQKAAEAAERQRLLTQQRDAIQRQQSAERAHAAAQAEQARLAKEAERLATEKRASDMQKFTPNRVIEGVITLANRYAQQKGWSEVYTLQFGVALMAITNTEDSAVPAAISDEHLEQLLSFLIREIKKENEKGYKVHDSHFYGQRLHALRLANKPVKHERFQYTRDTRSTAAMRAVHEAAQQPAPKVDLKAAFGNGPTKKAKVRPGSNKGQKQVVAA